MGPVVHTQLDVCVGIGNGCAEKCASQMCPACLGPIQINDIPPEVYAAEKEEGAGREVLCCTLYYLNTFPTPSKDANRYHLDAGDLKSMPCIGAPVVINPLFIMLYYIEHEIYQN